MGSPNIKQALGVGFKVLGCMRVHIPIRGDIGISLRSSSIRTVVQFLLRTRWSLEVPKSSPEMLQ